MSTLPHRLTQQKRARRFSIFNRGFKELFAAWVFSAPALLLLLIFLIIPFFMALYSSFTNQRLSGPLQTEFIWLDNFIELLSNETFHHALGNNFLFAAIVVPVQVALALSLAMLTNQKIKGGVFFRTVYFLPFATTVLVMAVVWRFFYQPDGIINAFLGVISFGHLGPYNWLADSNSPFLAMLAVVIMSVWQSLGYQMVCFLAGLQNISEDLYEAARIDGAGPWKRFIHVTIPQLRDVIILTVSMTAVLSFRLFAQVQILRGPGDSTRTVVQQIYEQGFDYKDIGLASAMTVVFFLIVFCVSIPKFIFDRPER